MHDSRRPGVSSDFVASITGIVAEHELERMWKETDISNFRHYIGIVELIPRSDFRCRVQDPNRGVLNYRSEANHLDQFVRCVDRHAP
jgi:hypothetical protein